MAKAGVYDRIVEIATRRGFFWPSFEIYGGLSGFFTYGNLGTKLKRNIENAWRRYFVGPHGFLEIDDPIINPQRVFATSGHIDHFKDYVVECSVCGRGFKVDNLIEEQTGLENVGAMSEEWIRSLLNENRIACPQCGGTLSEINTFLTMFKTTIGSAGGEVGYARPEAAQGMFLNFRRGFQHAREKLPFALAQIGKVLRNEISPRRGMHRLREYTIMELELFFDPQQASCLWLSEMCDEEISLLTEDMEERGEKTPIVERAWESVESGHIKTEWQAYFMAVSKRFVAYLGVPPERQRFRAHLPQERSHYSSQTFDHEVLLESWGWTEVAGHAYRTDYDLNAHQRGSGVDMTILRPDGTRFVPHVVEPSFGLDRLLYMSLEASYRRVKDRNILALPRSLAPINVSVFPLVDRDGLPERAIELYRLLLDGGLITDYDESGSIGRRYARADEIGTPIAVTIDYNTLVDGTVTLRERDSWSQVRQKTSVLTELLHRYLSGEVGFGDLGTPVKSSRG